MFSLAFLFTLFQKIVRRDKLHKRLDHSLLVCFLSSRDCLQQTPEITVSQQTVLAKLALTK